MVNAKTHETILNTNIADLDREAKTNSDWETFSWVTVQYKKRKGNGIIDLKDQELKKGGVKITIEKEKHLYIVNNLSNKNQSATKIDHLVINFNDKVATCKIGPKTMSFSLKEFNEGNHQIVAHVHDSGIYCFHGNEQYPFQTEEIQLVAGAKPISYYITAPEDNSSDIISTDQDPQESITEMAGLDSSDC